MEDQKPVDPTDRVMNISSLLLWGVLVVSLVMALFVNFISGYPGESFLEQWGVCFFGLHLILLMASLIYGILMLLNRVFGLGMSN